MPTSTLTRTLNIQEINVPGHSDNGGGTFDFTDPANYTIDFNYVGGITVGSFTEVVSTDVGNADYIAELAGIPEPAFTNGNSSVFGDIDDTGATGAGSGTEFITIGGVNYDYTDFGAGEFDIGGGLTETFLIIYVTGLDAFYAISLDNSPDPNNGNTKQSLGELDGTTTFYFSDIVCFTAGSLILTDKGEVPIETLQVGDLVQTVDEGLMPVRWVGSRKLSKVELNFSPKLRPILVRQNALGIGSPSRDTMLSPQHRILISSWQADFLFDQDEVLAPAKSLTNDHSIFVNHAAESVEYVHILFDTHQLVTVDGCVSESFFPYHTSLDAVEEAAKEEIFTLFPELRKDISLYGRAARISLKPYEVAAMVNFQQK